MTVSDTEFGILARIEQDDYVFVLAEEFLAGVTEASTGAIGAAMGYMGPIVNRTGLSGMSVDAFYRLGDGSVTWYKSQEHHTLQAGQGSIHDADPYPYMKCTLLDEGARVGSAPRAVAKQLYRNHGRRWTGGEIQRLNDYISELNSISWMAERLGRTPASVLKKLSELGRVRALW